MYTMLNHVVARWLSPINKTTSLIYNIRGGHPMTYYVLTIEESSPDGMVLLVDRIYRELTVSPAPEGKSNNKQREWLFGADYIPSKGTVWGSLL